MRIRLHRDCDPAILGIGPENAVRGHGEVPIAHRSLNISRNRCFCDLGGKELDASFGLRHVEPTSPTGTPTMVQRSQRGGDTEARRDEIRIGAIGSNRGRPLHSNEILEASDRCAMVAVTRVAGERS